MLRSSTKFSQLILYGNVKRPVWRICMWILRLQGLNEFVSFYHTTVLQEFIQEDIRTRYDLLMAWLYQEYSAYQVDAMEDESESSQSYCDCLLNLMDGLYSKLDPKDK